MTTVTKVFATLIAGIAGLIFMASAFADSNRPEILSYLENLEEGAEVLSLDLSQQSDTVATTTARICDYCQSLQLKTTATTEITVGPIDSNVRGSQRPLTLAETYNYRDNTATIFFNPATNDITRIEIYE